MHPSLQTTEERFLMDYDFELQEAYQLLNHTVAELSGDVADPVFSNLGLICGILTVNDEIELVVKFLNELRQYTKSEFMSQLVIVKD